MELKKFTAGGMSVAASTRSAGSVPSGASDLGDGLRSLAMGMAQRQDEEDYHAGVLSFAKRLNALDGEFENDQDLATLSQRRADRVRALSEQTLDGKSKRVREQLGKRFDLAMETDAAKWKAIVTKRDGANRVARFHEDTDEYLNHMIQAGTDDEFARAREMWNGRLEAIRPFMGAVEFARMRDGYSDQVKYRRAWNRIDGAGEFDPAPFNDLSPEQVGQLAARHNALARERQREIAERQADRAAALVPRLEDSLASAMTDGVPMDGTDAMLEELSGLGERGAAVADQMRAQFRRSATAFDVLDSVKDRPFAEQMAAVEGLRPEAGAEGYRADMEMYNRAGQMVMQRAKAFQADPAGFVRDEAERRARNAADSWVADEDLEPFVNRASLAIQRELGEREPKLLPVGQAKSLRDEFERADGDGKAQLLQQLGGYGEHTRQAMQELGLGLGQTFLADMYLDDPILGRKALDIASVKLSDIAVDPKVKKDVTKDLSAEYYSEGGPGDLFGRLYSLTGDPQWVDLNRQLYEATLKLGLADGDAPAAMARMWSDRFEIFVDEDVLIHTPKGVDSDDVAGKLRAYRRSLPPEFEAFRDGIWKNSGDGTGFTLVLPHGGRAMTEDGTENSPVMVVSYDELDAIAAVPESAMADTIYGAAVDYGPME